MLLPRTSACWYSANRRAGGMVVSCGQPGERPQPAPAGTPVPPRRAPSPQPAAAPPLQAREDRQ
jgi:hypothetical protein